MSTIPHADDSGSVSAVSVTFYVVPLADVARHSKGVDAFNNSQLNEIPGLGLWKWNYRTGQFDHDREFARITGTSQVDSIEKWSLSAIEEDRLKFLLHFNLLEAGVPEVEFAYKASRGNGAVKLHFVRAGTTNASEDQES